MSSILPTTVVGSYSVPEWLERAKTDFHQQRISTAYLRDIYEMATKAAIKDQERAGVDVITDGELRRDNDLDYFLERLPGVEIEQRAKTHYYDYYDASVPYPIPAGDDVPLLGLKADYLFSREQTDQAVKVAFTGPFSLAKRVRNTGYTNDEELVLAIAQTLQREARVLADAGAKILQIDEPFLAGHPEQVELAVRGINAVVKDIDVTWAVHICYGNRHARPTWAGHYDFLFPAILEANIDQLLLEFARKGYDDLALFRQYPTTFALGLGVVDVKSLEIESPAQVAARIERALDVLPADRLIINPDCGLRHVPANIAREKLHAMSCGAALVRDKLAGARKEVKYGVN